MKEEKEQEPNLYLRKCGREEGSFFLNSAGEREGGESRRTSGAIWKKSGRKSHFVSSENAPSLRGERKRRKKKAAEKKKKGGEVQV